MVVEEEEEEEEEEEKAAAVVVSISMVYNRVSSFFYIYKHLQNSVKKI